MLNYSFTLSIGFCACGNGSAAKSALYKSFYVIEKVFRGGRRFAVHILIANPSKGQGTAKGHKDKKPPSPKRLHINRLGVFCLQALQALQQVAVEDDCRRSGAKGQPQGLPLPLEMTGASRVIMFKVRVRYRYGYGWLAMTRNVQDCLVLILH